MRVPVALSVAVWEFRRFYKLRDQLLSLALGLVGGRTLSASDPRRVIALMTAVFGVGQIVGPAFAGWLFDRTGSFTLPSLLAAGTLVLAALLGAAVDWRILRAPPKPQPAP